MSGKRHKEIGDTIFECGCCRANQHFLEIFEDEHHSDEVLLNDAVYLLKFLGNN